MKSAPRKTSTVKKHHGPTSMPMSQWLMFWSLALCIIVFSYAAFANSEMPTQDTSAMDIDATQAISATIDQQLALQAQTQTAPAANGRVVFDGSQSVSDIAAINRDKPNLTVTYVDKTYKLAMDIPYNFDWGKPGLVLTPFDVNADTVSYGTLEQLEGALGRGEVLTISAKTTLDKARAAVKALSLESAAKESTVRGIPTVSYTLKGMSCRMVVAVGKSATYTFQDCHDGIPELEPEAVLATIRAQ